MFFVTKSFYFIEDCRNYPSDKLADTNLHGRALLEVQYITVRVVYQLTSTSCIYIDIKWQ